MIKSIDINTLLQQTHFSDNQNTEPKTFFQTNVLDTLATKHLLFTKCDYSALSVCCFFHIVETQLIILETQKDKKRRFIYDFKKK
ncbi:hypothetical protein DID76_04545, partial [Candidatus Marinamargulisbacteria bacterium SCGC AG-414-C22]